MSLKAQTIERILTVADVSMVKFRGIVNVIPVTFCELKTKINFHFLDGVPVRVLIGISVM